MRWISVVVASRLKKPSAISEGVNVSLFTLIQNASVSMRPPSEPSSRTRMLHHRNEIPEHQRRKLMSLGHSIGSITSMTVR
ncbi:Uncharacterised protein [Mycobacterium tuberculosis]|nr:Uncharacterised protein [Mycobacterium tuberculosis]